MKQLLIVEDDVCLRENLKRLLEQHCFEVMGVGRGADALRALDEKEFHLVILDLGLPDTDGLDVCRYIRQRWLTPILMLTARTETMDRVLGLEMGADDYLTKPFEPKELLARVRALMRRTYEYPQTASSTPSAQQFGELVIDFERRQVSVRGQPVVLTRREFDLLAFMARHPRRVLTRDWLFEQVWGYTIEYSSNTLDAYIYRLRKKIERDPQNPEYIHTHRNFGYEFRPPDPF